MEIRLLKKLEDAMAAVAFAQCGESDYAIQLLGVEKKKNQKQFANKQRHKRNEETARIQM